MFIKIKYELLPVALKKTFMGGRLPPFVKQNQSF